MTKCANFIIIYPIIQKEHGQQGALVYKGWCASGHEYLWGGMDRLCSTLTRGEFWLVLETFELFLVYFNFQSISGFVPSVDDSVGPLVEQKVVIVCSISLGRCLSRDLPDWSVSYFAQLLYPMYILTLSVLFDSNWTTKWFNPFLAFFPSSAWTCGMR